MWWYRRTYHEVRKVWVAAVVAGHRGGVVGCWCWRCLHEALWLGVVLAQPGGGIRVCGRACVAGCEWGAMGSAGVRTGASDVTCTRHVTRLGYW
jgi:hypothetical protein